MGKYMDTTVAEATNGTGGLLAAVVWDRKSSIGSMASSSGCTRKEEDGMYNGGSSGCSCGSGNLLSKVGMVSGALTSFVCMLVDISKVEMGLEVVHGRVLNNGALAPFMTS